MNKETRSVVAEYAACLSDEQLRDIISRLSDKFQDDLATAISLMSKDRRMDNVLSIASSGVSFYELLDQIKNCLAHDLKKRRVAAAS